MKISNPPDKEFKTMVIKMLTELRKRMAECSENFNKEREKLKYQIEVMELRKTITKGNNMLEDSTADWKK